MGGYWCKEDRIRFVEHRPYFLFVFESQLTINTIKQKLQDYYHKNSTPVTSQIDAVFCLDRGTIFNFGDGEGSFQYAVKDISQPGLIIDENTEKVLFNLMTWFSMLPKYSYPHSPLQMYLVS